MSEGFRSVLQYAGHDDVAIVLRGGSNDEMASGLSLEQTRLIADAPQVVRCGRRPAGFARSSTSSSMCRCVTTGTAANVPLRGVGPHAAGVAPGFPHA